MFLLNPIKGGAAEVINVSHPTQLGDGDGEVFDVDRFCASFASNGGMFVEACSESYKLFEAVFADVADVAERHDLLVGSDADL